jgi:SNF2 family DNA or RNA helicase
MGNWEKEITKFAPSLKVLLHHGAGRKKDEEFIAEAGRHDLVVTTYSLLHRDEAFLKGIEWSVLVLDEAQNIKNPWAKQSQAARSLQGRFRVALTGTPVENRLAELWSIMNFLNPAYLGGEKEFRSRFAVPIERYQNREAGDRLRRLVRPFVLRRLKTDPTVIADLPTKTEMKVYCTLTREQATLYRAVVKDMRLLCYYQNRTAHLAALT